jgi:DNA modification methylase
VTPYYQDESVTLYHGDCRDIAAWLEADVLVTDPPYGYRHSSSHGASWQNTEIANDHDTGARDDALAIWGNRPALVFGSWKRPAPHAAVACLVWDKGPAFGMGDLSLPWKPNHEQIYVIGKGFTGRRAGSGSTLVAAKQLGRQSIGVELDERYCEITAKRLSQGVIDFGAVS